MIASNYVPDINSVIINEIEPSSEPHPHLDYTQYGNITREICVFDSAEQIYMKRLSDPFNLSGSLEYSRNSSGILISLDGLVELEGYADPFPLKSKIHFYVEVLAITGDLFISLKMYDYEVKKQVLVGHQILEFTCYVGEISEGIFYEYRSFKIIIESADGEVSIFLGRILAVAESAISLVPIKINYYDLRGVLINDSYIEEDGTLYLFGIRHLYLDFEYYSPSLMQFLSIYVKYPINIIYFEPNVTISSIYICMDSYTYSEPIAQQLRVPENKGLNINVTLPLYNISFFVLYLNDLAEIEYLSIYYDDILFPVFSISKRTFTRFNNVYFFLIPGKYSISIQVRGSFKDFLISLKIIVENRDMVVKIKLNAYNLNGIVLRIDALIFQLITVLLGFLMLVMPLILPDTRERYLQVLRRPIFYAMIALIASAFMPSFTMKIQYNGYIKQIEQLMIIEFPLIVFQKNIDEKVYVAGFSLFGFFYSFIFAIFWFFYALKILLNEMSKPSINVDIKYLKKSLKISLIAKIIYLSFPTLMMQITSPIQLLRIIPGPGIFLYVGFILLVVAEIKRGREFELTN